MRKCKVYDPYIKYNLVENQFFDFNEFLAETDLIVIMVGHSEIINNAKCLQDKIVFDTRNVINGENVYHI